MLNTIAMLNIFLSGTEFQIFFKDSLMIGNKKNKKKNTDL